MKNPNLVGVVYVGKKPTAHDNVAGSGKVWNGKGDVQHVTEGQAVTLTKYADQWERAPVAPSTSSSTKGDDKGSAQQEGGAGTAGAGTGAGGDDPGGKQGSGDGGGDPETEFSPEELATILKTPIEKLSKPKLIAFAKHKLNKRLDPALGKTTMVNEIHAWMKQAE